MEIRLNESKAFKGRPWQSPGDSCLITEYRHTLHSCGGRGQFEAYPNPTCQHVGGNRSTRRKPTTSRGRALSDSFHKSVKSQQRKSNPRSQGERHLLSCFEDCTAEAPNMSGLQTCCVHSTSIYNNAVVVQKQIAYNQHKFPQNRFGPNLFKKNLARSDEK
jgi:hypothetical protein